MPRRGAVTLDDIDRQILAELAEDGRLSNVELADRVGLSPSPCLRRVRRLGEDGVIRGYRAQVDPSLVERGMTAYASIRLRAHERELNRRFEEGARQLPMITEIHHLAGDVDYLLRVEVADLREYDRFTREVITGLPGVGQVTSTIVLSTLKDEDRGI